MGTKHKVVTGYAQMWPREVFYIKENNRLLDNVKKCLSECGVYILYRENQPHYVGQTTRPLFNRIADHANKPNDEYYNFWNFFSAFVVPENHLDEVEGILIAAMPSIANSASKSVTQTRIYIPREVGQILHRLRRIDKE